MNRLKQLIGETKAIFASVLCLLSFVLLAPSAQAAKTYTADLTGMKGNLKKNSVKSFATDAENGTVIWVDVADGSGVSLDDRAWSNGKYKIYAGCGNVTRIEMTCTVKSLSGEGWSQAGFGCVWEGCVPANVGVVVNGQFESATKLVVTTDEPLWAKSRKVKVDLRERLVVVAPEEVLPIAYNTNAWAGVSGAWQAKVTYGLDTPEDEVLVPVTNVSGYAEWTPEEGVFGKYQFKLFAEQLDGAKQTNTKNGTIYYTTYFPLTLTASADGTYAATTNGVEATGSFDLLGYSYVNLAATPDAHYQFAGWTATTNGVAYADGFTNTATLVTRFEMPNSEATLGATFAWQSVFKDRKTVAEGETWEVFGDDDYRQGLTNNGTVVWKPGVTNKLGKASFLDDFGQLKNGADGKLRIVFDETLTNGTYRLAGYAFSAEKKTFEITNGVEAEDCTVVGPDDLKTAAWVYVGAKRFKLGCDSFGNLRLVVEWGVLQSVVIADDFSANPPFADWNADEGTFTWNGRSWTNGVNAFTSFTDLYTNEMYAACATNLHVFGEQTIASEPPADLAWDLDLVAYEEAPGVTNAPVVTVGTTADGRLLDITNELARITGAGTIVLSKTEDALETSIYDPYIADPDAIVVKNAGVEPTKEPSGDVVVDVDGRAKEDPGSGVVILPGNDDLEHDYRVTIAADAPAAVVGCKVKARNALIVNYGHYEDEYAVAGRLVITNGSVNTLVGTYRAGGEIQITGVYGSLSDVVIDAAGELGVSGVNVLTGPVDYRADGIVHAADSRTVWSVAGDNRRAMIDFADVAGSASLGVLIDGEHATNELAGVSYTNVYAIASNATASVGRTFALEGDPLVEGLTLEVADGADAADVEAKKAYAGLKAYSLRCEDDGEGGKALVFEVDWARFAVTLRSRGCSATVAPAATHAIVGGKARYCDTVTLTTAMKRQGGGFVFDRWELEGVAPGAETVTTNDAGTQVSCTFVMPLEAVTATAVYVPSVGLEDRRTAGLETVSNAAEKATAEIKALDVGEDVKTAALAQVEQALAAATEAIAGAADAGAVDAAVRAAESSFASAVNAAALTKVFEGEVAARLAEPKRYNAFTNWCERRGLEPSALAGKGGVVFAAALDLPGLPEEGKSLGIVSLATVAGTNGTEWRIKVTSDAFAKGSAVSADLLAVAFGVEGAPRLGEGEFALLVSRVEKVNVTEGSVTLLVKPPTDDVQSAYFFQAKGY